MADLSDAFIALPGGYGTLGVLSFGAVEKRHANDALLVCVLLHLHSFADSVRQCSLAYILAQTTRQLSPGH